MKKFFTLLSLFFIGCVTLWAGTPTPTAETTQPLSIVHPYEYEEIPLWTRLLSMVQFPRRKLGSMVSPCRFHPSGGFITMVKLEPGEFQIKAELQLGNEVYHLTRTIIVAEPEKIPPATPLTIQHVTPGAIRVLPVITSKLHAKEARG